MMKRFFFVLLAMSCCGVASICAAETVQAVQSRLKQGGFYDGPINGVYNSATAAAVTRYQIRNGLPISGKLDAETTKALGLTVARATVPTPKVGEDVWIYLRKSDEEYLKRLLAAEQTAHNESKKLSPGTANSLSNSPAPPPAVPMPSTAALTRERLRDYVGAFVLAGLNPQVASELEFFADHVDYFGEKNAPREKIRQDLLRYDKRWPERRFWLAGELTVDQLPNGRLKVTFPLRYELERGSRRASGKVLKTLVLTPVADDLQIIAVNERNAK